MKRFLLSVGYATKGVVRAFKTERNIRVQMLMGILVTIAGFYFEITNAEWIALLLTSGIVISLELINTAIEGLVDLISRERHPIAGRVKDIAAGAVLFFSLIALITGILIFKKYIV